MTQEIVSLEKRRAALQNWILVYVRNGSQPPGKSHHNMRHESYGHRRGMASAACGAPGNEDYLSVATARCRRGVGRA
jgi:hypothetical protein